MPSLRRGLSGPGPYLAILAAAAALVLADAGRAPAAQVTARSYVGIVRMYQHHHSLTAGLFRCRYVPTCSEYSVQAVERYGVERGLVLTLRRISSCRGTVPFGTSDPLR